MARSERIDVGGVVYHVINRSNERAPIFHTTEDYLDFEYLLNEVRETYAMRILAYIIMPNHWHLLLYPRRDGDMGKALQWLGTAHARRYRSRQDTVGYGHVYQGRYKSFPVEEDWHCLTVLKYIERNPARAKLVPKPEDWRWGSAWRRIHGSARQQELLAELPLELPRNYRAWLNEPELSEELDNVRHSVVKSVSYGKLPQQ